MKPKRNRLPGEIQRAAPDLAKQHRLAAIGKEPGHLEAAARDYLAFPDAMKRVNAPQQFRDELRQLLIENVRLEFLHALETKDANALRDVADLLDELRKNPNPRPADPLRSAVLLIKEAFQKPMTLRELARHLGYSGDMDSLRAVAKEVDFPLGKDVAGRPPKNAGT